MWNKGLSWSHQVISPQQKETLEICVGDLQQSGEKIPTDLQVACCWERVGWFNHVQHRGAARNRKRICKCIRTCPWSCAASRQHESSIDLPRKISRGRTKLRLTHTAVSDDLQKLVGTYSSTLSLTASSREAPIENQYLQLLLLTQDAQLIPNLKPKLNCGFASQLQMEVLQDVEEYDVLQIIQAISISDSLLKYEYWTG